MAQTPTEQRKGLGKQPTNQLGAFVKAFEAIAEFAFTDQVGKTLDDTLGPRRLYVHTRLYNPLYSAMGDIMEKGQEEFLHKRLLKR